MLGLSYLRLVFVDVLSTLDYGKLWGYLPGYDASPKRVDDLVSAAWWVNWRDDFPASDVSWEKYTHVTYAFAETASNPSTVSLSGDDSGNILREFVGQAHANNVKALVSVGGWSGSRYWSTAVKSASARTTFVNTLTSLVNEYDLDGLDFDWEYPNSEGAGNNEVSSKDTANFLLFIQQLRSTDVGKSLVLTAATAIQPFIDANGNPSSDVSGFADVLDWIAIMNYDIWGSWSATVGPNAPLVDSCAPSAAQQGSATSAVAAWNAAGIPLNQLVLGVAAYGHSYTVSAGNAYPNGKDKSLALYPPFSSADDEETDFADLIESGYLSEAGKPVSGVGYLYDNCTQTPYVYDSSSKRMVAFDDPTSFAAKGKFIKNKGLAGFAMWEAGGDYNDLLLNAITSSAT